MVPSAAPAAADPNVMEHWPRPGEFNSQRPARSIAAAGCVTSGAVLDPGKLNPVAQPASAGSARIRADARRAGRMSCMRSGYFIVGMTNSAPSLVPDGQRAVTVLVLV